MCLKYITIVITHVEIFLHFYIQKGPEMGHALGLSLPKGRVSPLPGTACTKARGTEHVPVVNCEHRVAAFHRVRQAWEAGWKGLNVRVKEWGAFAGKTSQQGIPWLDVESLFPAPFRLYKMPLSPGDG